jgi:hypothetical protein
MEAHQRAPHLEKTFPRKSFGLFGRGGNGNNSGSNVPHAAPSPNQPSTQARGNRMDSLTKQRRLALQGALMQ